MLNEILGIKNIEDFSEVSHKLTSIDNWRELQIDCCNSGVVIYKSDMWTTDEIKRLTRGMDFLGNVLEAVKKEKDGKKLMHMLQIIGHCNPGLKDKMSNHIERTAL